MDYLGVLTDKRTSVWAELEGLRAEQRRLAELIGIKEAQLRNIDELLAYEVPGAALVEATSGRPVLASFLDVADEVIQKAAAPVHYQEILLRLNSRGVNVPGKDPAANLIAHLSRDPRFVRTGRGTYGLRSLHEPAAVPQKRPVRTRRSRQIAVTGKKA